MDFVLFFVIAMIILFVIVYRKNSGKNMYKYIIDTSADAYNKYAPYSFKSVHDKVRELDQDYTVREYTIQVITFSVGAFVVSYLYF
jgi:hypothetical protein